MPSPFPGMVPYLEGSLWTTFQFAFGAELVRQLAPQLRPRYLALPVERMVFDETNDVAITTSSFYPDVGILNVQPPINQISVESHTAPLQLATVIPETFPHINIEIRDTANH